MPKKLSDPSLIKLSPPAVPPAPEHVIPVPQKDLMMLRVGVAHVGDAASASAAMAQPNFREVENLFDMTVSFDKTAPLRATLSKVELSTIHCRLSGANVIRERGRRHVTESARHIAERKRARPMRARPSCPKTVSIYTE